MATINDLINAACEIRDADQDRENTAMRVGSLLVDIIDYIGGFVSISTLQNILADYAALDSRGQVEWRQARVISLYSMGTEYDNVDGGDWTPESSPVGSVVYEKSGSNHRLHFKKTSDTIEDYPCFLNVIYINLHSLRLYTFSETEGMVELNTNAAGGGGTTVTITKGGGYVDIDIIDNTPRITLSTQSIAMSGNDKTATFKVSGVNLKGPISINGNNAYFSKSPRSISPVGGVVNETTVTVTFGGTNDDTDDLTVSSPGATAQTIHVAYTAVAGPNIIVSPASLSFKAATNQTQTKQVAVQGSLLTDDVEVTAGGAFQVSLQSGSGFTNSVTIPKASALAGITVYVRYTAGSSATTGTLTLTSDGAADKTVDLAGYVSTLTVSPSSLSLSSSVGVQATGTFDVEGSALVDDVTLSVEGSLLQQQTVSFSDQNAGKYINKTGGISNGSTDWHYTTEYIPIENFVKTALFSKSTNIASVALYDSNKTFIGYYQPSSAYAEIAKADLASSTFTVQGKDINDVAFVRLSNGNANAIYLQYVAYVATDASSDFSVLPASISEVDGEASGTVTVGFTPSAAGSYSGKVTVSSGSVSKEVTITGTAS